MINKHLTRGFTLIELMIVVAIIGVLAAIAVPSYQTYVEKTNLAHVRQEMVAVRQALASEKVANPRDLRTVQQVQDFVDRQIARIPNDIRRKYTISANVQDDNNGTRVLVMTAQPSQSSYKYAAWSGAQGSVLRCPKNSVSSQTIAQPSGCEAL